MSTPHNPAAVLEAALAAAGVPTDSQTPAIVTGPVVGVGKTIDGTQVEPPPPDVAAGSEPPAPQELSAEALAQMAMANATQEPQAPQGAPAKARSPLLQKLLETVGGDEDRLAELLLNQMSGTSQLHQRVNQVLEELSKPKAPAAEFDASSHPQVKFHSDQIAVVDAEMKANEGQLAQLANDATQTNDRLREAYGARKALQSLGDAEKLREIDTEITGLRNEYSAKYAEYQRVVSENKRLSREKTQYGFSRDQAIANAKAQHEASIAQSEEQKIAETQFTQATNAEFDTALEKHAARYKLGVTPEFRADLVSRFDRFVNSLPEHQRRGASVNLDWFVGTQLDAMAKTWGLSPKQEFTQESRVKTAAAIAAMGRQAVAAVAPPAQGQPNWDQLPPSIQARAAKDHARRVLNAASGLMKQE